MNHSTLSRHDIMEAKCCQRTHEVDAAAAFATADDETISFLLKLNLFQYFLDILHSYYLENRDSDRHYPHIK